MFSFGVFFGGNIVLMHFWVEMFSFGVWSKYSFKAFLGGNVQFWGLVEVQF